MLEYVFTLILIHAMKHYKKLRKIRERLVLLPGLRSYKDFDISIEIGYHEHKGSPLTLKQLLLENIASEVTVRRHLSRLIKEGLVEKKTEPSRSTLFSFSTDRKVTQHL